MKTNGSIVTEINSGPADGAAWQPRIVAFLCNRCAHGPANLAGVADVKDAPNVRVVRLLCSGRLDTQFVLAALAQGADGVLVGRCKLSDCHHAEGNHKTLSRLKLFKRLLHDLSIEEQRVRVDWIPASDGNRLQSVVDEMVEQIRVLGPLNLPKRFKDWEREMTVLASEVHEAELGEC